MPRPTPPARSRAFSPRIRLNADRELRGALRSATDPASAERLFHVSLRHGDRNGSAEALLLLGSGRANELLNELAKRDGKERDRIALALGRRLIELGWQPNFPAGATSTGWTWGDLVWTTKKQARIHGDFGRARTWRVPAFFKISGPVVDFRHDQLELQSPEFTFGSGKHYKDSRRDIPYAVRSRVADLGWARFLRMAARPVSYLARWGNGTSLFGANAGFSFHYPSNEAHQYLSGMATSGTEETREAFAWTARIGVLPDEDPPPVDLDGPEIMAWLNRPERKEAIKNLFYADLWLASDWIEQNTTFTRHGVYGTLERPATVDPRVMQAPGTEFLHVTPGMFRNPPGVDRGLRELERKWLEQGATEDGYHWLLARQRAGQKITPRDLIQVGLADGLREPRYNRLGDQVVTTGNKSFDQQAQVAKTGQVTSRTQVSNIVRAFNDTAAPPQAWRGDPPEPLPGGHLQNFDLSHFAWSGYWPEVRYVREFVRHYARDEPVMLYEFMHHLPDGRRRVHGFVLTDMDNQLIEVFSRSSRKSELVMETMAEYVSWWPLSQHVEAFGYKPRRPLSNASPQNIHGRRLGRNPDPGDRGLRELERRAQTDPDAAIELIKARIRAGQTPTKNAWVDNTVAFLAPSGPPFNEWSGGGNEYEFVRSTMDAAKKMFAQGGTPYMIVTEYGDIHFPNSFGQNAAYDVAWLRGSYVWLSSAANARGSEGMRTLRVRVKPDHWTGMGVSTGTVREADQGRSLVRWDDGTLTEIDNMAIEAIA